MSNIAWQLGNEPNSLRHTLNFTMDPHQLGKDFWRLKRLLKKFPMFENNTLVGPDVNGLRKCNLKENPMRCHALKYLKKVLNSSGGVLDAVTWHHYYLNGRTATLDQFTDPAVLDTLEDILDMVKNFTKQAQVFQPLWLGETSSAYGGGAHGLSNRFVAGYNWLDKLGMTARYGYQVVIRQSFYHGCYALIGEDLEPFPDFWLSALYKKLVGPTVLTLGIDNRGKSTRLYAHCTPEEAARDEGSVTVFGFNMGNTTSVLDMGVMGGELDIDAYILTPQGGNLTSEVVLLNDKALQLLDNRAMPPMEPVKSRTTMLYISPGEVVFWVIHSKTGACSSGK